MDSRAIRRLIAESDWRCGVPYRNANRPMSTFNEIVSGSFEDVKRIGRDASHYRLDTMYQPELGSLRQSRSYSALAPTNGMKYSLRHVPSDMRPFSAYKREKSEYDLVVAKHAAKHAANTRRLPANITTDSSLPPLPPTYRKQYPVPDKPRYENLQLYFGGRARGLEYSQPGLFDLERDDYSPMEDRRYHRLFWSKEFMPHVFPSARHSRSAMLSGY